MVDKGILGTTPEKNSFGWYTLVRYWPDRFEEIKPEEPRGYMYSWELVTWGLVALDIMTPITELTDSEIREVVYWIGMRSMDTIFIDGDKPVFGRIGIDLMLFITLMEFPEYYIKYKLA